MGGTFWPHLLAGTFWPPRKNIPVVAFNVDDYATRSARLSSVNQNYYQAGRKLAEHVAAGIPDGAHILMTKHDEGVSALEDRLRGMQDVLKPKGVRWTVIVMDASAIGATHRLQLVPIAVGANDGSFSHRRVVSVDPVAQWHSRHGRLMGGPFSCP